MADWNKINQVLDNLDWLGHSAFRLSCFGLKIYFDPYNVKGAVADASLILITHDHFDHCDLESINKLKNSDTFIVTGISNTDKFSECNIKIMKPGDKIKIFSITIEALFAYNMKKKFHPKNEKGLGFVVEVDGVRLYHMGDTDYIPEMDELNVDVMLVPVSGVYVMSSIEAVESVKKIKPKVAVPMHYGSIVGTKRDAEEFCQLLEGIVSTRIIS